MELKFQKSTVQYLKTALRQLENQEQTQELRLPEDMPDIGRVLGSWGQIILRSKEWRSDGIAFSGGIMVWVLYAPEDGAPPRWVESWIPFQMKQDLDGSRDGTIRLQCALRFVDARSVSARKMMLRCGIAALAEAFVEDSESCSIPGEVPEDIQLLTASYPVRLPREAGEKAFTVEETLEGAPATDKIVYYHLEPKITETRIMGDKVVFRGTGNLHVLFAPENGKLHSRDFQVPFSQYADLRGNLSPEAQADIRMCVTSMELDKTAEGELNLKCGLLAQYLVDDREMLELVEDAYSTIRDVQLQKEGLELPAILETRQATVPVHGEVRQEAAELADVTFRPDFPTQQRGEKVEFTVPGQFQVLYYGQEGTLQSASPRAEGQWQMPSDEHSRTDAVVLPGSGPAGILGSGISLEASPILYMTTRSTAGIPMVTGLNITERKAESNRPSLILRRTGSSRLWDIAKSTGSTVAAIKQANGLEEEPVKDQILLIPIH